MAPECEPKRNSPSWIRIQERHLYPTADLLLDADYDVLSQSEQSKFLNELAMIHSASCGVQNIIVPLLQREEQICAAKPALRKCIIQANDPSAAMIFQAYSVAIVNLCWLIGLVLRRSNKIQLSPAEYRATSAGPYALAFRNKIGAHYAIAHNDKRDSDEERLTSTIAGNLLLRHGRFYAPFGEAEIGKAKKKPTKLQPFSATEHYFNMWERYWATPHERGTITPLPWHDHPIAIRAEADAPGKWFRIDLRDYPHGAPKPKYLDDRISQRTGSISE